MLLLPLLYCFKGLMAMCSCKLLVCFVSCVRCTTANSSVCATFLFGTGPVVQACVVSVVFSWRGGAPRTSSCSVVRTAAMFAKMLASCGNDVGEAEPPVIVCTLPLFAVCLRACAQYLLFCAACVSWHKVHATCFSRRPRLIQAATHWQAPALRPAPVGQSQ